MEEFVESLRRIRIQDQIKGSAAIPQTVLDTVVADFAVRVFKDVDVDNDGTLEAHELADAFARKRADLLARAEAREFKHQLRAYVKLQWMHLKHSFRRLIGMRRPLDP